MPFSFRKLNKKAAKTTYKHLTGKAFIPSVFRQENHIDEIVGGLYVPFLGIQYRIEADISYDAEKIRVWSPGIPNIQSTNIIKSAGEAQSILNMCRKTVL